MNHSTVIQFAAGLEEVLDTRLFRARPEDERNSATPRETDPLKIAAGAAGVGAVGVGGLVAKDAVGKYANSAAVNDRLAGLRSTVPGFTQKTPGMQRTVATVSRAGSDIAGGVKTAATKIGKEAAYRGQGLYNAAENAGIGALRKAKPLARGLLGRVGALVTKLK